MRRNAAISLPEGREISMLSQDETGNVVVCGLWDFDFLAFG